MDLQKLLDGVTHFIWDEHNREKNWRKHHVGVTECEEVFSDPDLQFDATAVRPSIEERWAVLGQTKRNRQLIVFFTIRKRGIRVISARPMSQKERRKYEQEKENSEL